MHACMCMYICIFVVEQDTGHWFHKYEQVCLLSERKKLASKNACHTCFSARQEFPVYST